jgi:hypothetical protein
MIIKLVRFVFEWGFTKNRWGIERDCKTGRDRRYPPSLSHAETAVGGLWSTRQLVLTQLSGRWTTPIGLEFLSIACGSVPLLTCSCCSSARSHRLNRTAPEFAQSRLGVSWRLSRPQLAHTAVATVRRERHRAWHHAEAVVGNRSGIPHSGGFGGHTPLHPSTRNLRLA